MSLVIAVLAGTGEILDEPAGIEACLASIGLVGCCMRLPQPVPELPVRSIQEALRVWTRQLGFTVDWTYEGQFAGLSRDDARVFLRLAAEGEPAPPGSGALWFNMNSAAEVDQVHSEWASTGVTITAELRTTPYKLREFTATDADGNRIRVFHDMADETA